MRGALCACAKLAGTSPSGRVRKIVHNTTTLQEDVLVKQLVVSPRRGPVAQHKVRVLVSFACEGQDEISSPTGDALASLKPCF